MSFITYTTEEINIVEAGFEEVQNILKGMDTGKKRRLLFCLDRYLDPYYGYHLEYEEELVKLLETVIISPNDIAVQEDALNLLIDYAEGPFCVLEEYYNEIAEMLKPHAKYIINRYKIRKVEQLALKECQNIFEENRALSAKYDMGKFPEEAVIIYNTVVSADNDDYVKNDINHIKEIWNLKQGVVSAGSVSQDIMQEYRISHYEEFQGSCFYQKGAFYFNIDLNSKELCLIYEFGPRYGRCLVYRIHEFAEDFTLENPVAMWVM